MCILFTPNEVGMSSSQSTGQLVKTGFTNWKRFNKHNCSEYHTQSALKFDNFINLMKAKFSQ